MNLPYGTPLFLNSEIYNSYLVNNKNLIVDRADILRYNVNCKYLDSRVERIGGSMRAS